jgi:hypothetical protein
MVEYYIVAVIVKGSSPFIHPTITGLSAPGINLNLKKSN